MAEKKRKPAHETIPSLIKRRCETFFTNLAGKANYTPREYSMMLSEILDLIDLLESTIIPKGVAIRPAWDNLETIKNSLSKKADELSQLINGQSPVDTLIFNRTNETIKRLKNLNIGK